MSIHEDFDVQLVGMFDTAEKWIVYLEMVRRKDDIRNRWYRTLGQEMRTHFLADDVKEWGVTSWEMFDMKWFLREFGENSVCLVMGWMGQLHLRVWGEQNDVIKVREEVIQAKYAPLIAAFDRKDKMLNGPEIVMEAAGNYCFGTPYDGHFDSEMLAWYAGNRTADLVEQIAAKVDRYRKSPEVTQLLIDLNRNTRK